MADLPGKDVAQITLAALILKFISQERAKASSVLVRAAPDLIIDLVGEDKYNECKLNGTPFSFYDVRIAVDDEMEYGYAAIEWKH